MKKLILLVAALLSTSSFAANPVVVMNTNMGDITIELNETLAPVTVKNFLTYVDEKFYDNTIFHRVIDGFMIQGGGLTEDMTQKKTHKPIKNEAANGLSNTTGSIAMARTSVVDSATAQFFINVNDNTFLDHRSNAPSEFGYAVFGRVTNGMSVVNAIKKQATGNKMGHQNVPLKSIVINSVRRVPEAPNK